MEHPDDAPLADETQPGSIPNDQPSGGPVSPEDPPAPSEGDRDEDDLRPPDAAR
ncbi:MAG TPA: hypothetical protein VG474_00155 [Solirubrobacteraceae bacterium]|nr:hypothetical protein [Solirubrobacteraceae bacterium]